MNKRCTRENRRGTREEQERNKNRFSPLFTKRLLRDSLVFDCLGKTFSLGVVTHRDAAVSDEAAGTAMFFYIKTVRAALMQSAP